MAQSGISVHDADVSSHLHTNHGVTSKQKTLAVVHEAVNSPAKPPPRMTVG
jgi:hypothetical protein